MLLSTIASVLSAFLFAQSTHAALNPGQVVANIKIVTQLSGSANLAITKLSTTSSFDDVHTIGQTLAVNFQTIIKSLSSDVVAMKSTPPFSDDVTQPIVDTLRAFVMVHQALLSTVIGKHGILAQFAITGPILLVLNSLEAIIDGFAFAMIDLIPTRKKDVQSDKLALDGSVKGSISIYSQFCIPSPFYPLLMPVCVAL